MKLSLFVKSHAADFEWLKWSRDSVRKFGNGVFDEIVLCLPEGQTFDWPEARTVYVRETFTGYLFQMGVKAYADAFCSGDVIVFNDSDTVFTRPLKREDFIKDGKPIWIYTPFDEARKDQSVWVGPMRKFVGTEPTVEVMRRHCFSWPREFFQKLRAFCRYQHGMELCDYIKAQEVPGSPLALTFSEFNCAGWFSHSLHPEFFTWVKDSDSGEAYVYQGWTHDGQAQLQQDIAKFREILDSTPSEVDAEVRKPKNLTEGIRTLVEALASLADGNRSSRIPMIHEELRKAGILGHKGRKLGSKNKPKELVTA